MRAAGAESIALAHPDLAWRRPSPAAQASMSSQELEDDFQAFMDRIDSIFLHPGMHCMTAAPAVPRLMYIHIDTS